MMTEPRSMSLADVMTGTIGVAVGFLFITNDHTNYSTWPKAVLVLERSLTTIGVISLAITSALIGRQVRYRRRPLPSEWLSIVITIAFTSYMVVYMMNLEISASWLKFTSDRSTDRNWLRLFASFSILVFILSTLRRTRQWLPPWATTLGLGAWLVVMLCGLIPLADEQSDNWLVRSDENYIREVGRIYYVSLKAISRTPFIMFFYYPAIGVIACSRRRCDWTWIEWASVGLLISRTLIVEVCLLFSMTTPIGSLYWSVDQATELLAIAASLLLTWLINARVGSISRFFYADPQPEHSTPSVTSPPSTA